MKYFHLDSLVMPRAAKSRPVSPEQRFNYFRMDMQRMGNILYGLNTEEMLTALGNETRSDTNYGFRYMLVHLKLAAEELLTKLDPDGSFEAERRRELAELYAERSPEPDMTDRAELHPA